ncbi:F-box protein-like [Dorcoceras hygrometricum]|uniref:F-box protein-like n=1 Tax=Dorcoceras hygrometricum TaxID=472368 RepID=A0A2Z7C8J4_9LAMI|nr:F-box protein-like [Dorcoceras hygrometricum]
MIYESSFTQIHCDRTKTKSGYFIQDIRHNEYVSEFVSYDNDNTLPTGFLPKKSKILARAANQGILCCEKELAKRQCRYYVCVHRIFIAKTRERSINTGVYRSKHLSEYEGKLGFTCLTEKGDMDLWIMDDIKIHSWKKEKSANIESLRQVLTHPSPAGFYNSGISFLKGFYEVGFYMHQDRSVRSVKLDKLDDAREVFRFNSDIDPAHLSLI